MRDRHRGRNWYQAGVLRGGMRARLHAVRPRSFKPVLLAGIAAVGTMVALLAACVAHADEPARGIDLTSVSTDSGVLTRVLGNTGNGAFGVPVAGALDCDADGYKDYAFAAMTASPAGRSGAGEVYLVFGNGGIGATIDTALARPDVLRIIGAATSEACGSELWMDDVTGDGLGDLLIARQNFNPDPSRPGAGALTVLVGSASLRSFAATMAPLDLAAPPASLTVLNIVGPAATDRLGIWVRSGDVTGDGTADLVIGADQVSTDAAHHMGAVYVVRGGLHLAGGGTVDLSDLPTTALAGNIATLVPPASGSSEFHFGATCQIADLDGNDRAEVLVGATINRAGASLAADGAPFGAAHASAGALRGRLYIVWDDNFPEGVWPAGLTIDVSAAPGSTTEIRGGVGNRSFGEEILGGLDFNSDGKAELFVGDIVGDLSPRRDRLSAGSGHLFYDAAQLRGAAFDMDNLPQGLVTTTFLGGKPNDIAADTAMQGDFNGDGVADLAFSSPHGSRFGRVNAGTIHVFFGQHGRWPAIIDLAEGALVPSAFVSVVEIYGANGSAAADGGDTLCYSAAAADVDGDGLSDIITNEMQGNGSTAVDVGNMLLIGGAMLSAPVAPGNCPARPLAGCHSAVSARLRAVKRAAPSSDRVAWKWKGAAESSAFRDPLNDSGATYRLCVYEDAASPALVAGMRTTGSGSCGQAPCWSAQDPTEFSYFDSERSSDGIERINLRLRPQRPAVIRIRAREHATSIPSLPSALPVVVQFSASSDGVSQCFESSFFDTLANEPGRLLAQYRE